MSGSTFLSVAQSWSSSADSNPTDGLTRALGPDLITRLQVISERLFLWKWPKVSWSQPNNSLKKLSSVASRVWTENLPIFNCNFLPARPLPQILKLIGYLIRNIFMEKVCRKPVVKTSSMHIFHFVNSPKQPMHVWDFWK